tara:strand:+ start:3365 stop:3982 length:618 start_codon:yes stop_codon:yes gene_type:complete
MKLHKTHLFLILIAVLVLSTLGFTVREYFENKDSSSEKAMEDSVENKAPEGTEGLSSSGDNGSDYQSVISDLEDIVVPGRRERKHHHDSGGNHRHGHHGEKRRERKLEKRERRLEKEVERQERRMAEDAGVDMSKYILKSEVVPPVCPKCPDSRTCPRQKPCPPCAPCARCPEPAFECKKVPNYRAATVSNILPLPRLNSFAAFN